MQLYKIDVSIWCSGRSFLFSISFVRHRNRKIGTTAGLGRTTNLLLRRNVKECLVRSDYLFIGDSVLGKT